MSKRILPCTYRFLVVLAALSISWTGTILLAQEVPPGWSAAARGCWAKIHSPSFVAKGR